MKLEEKKKADGLWGSGENLPLAIMSVDDIKKHSVLQKNVQSPKIEWIKNKKKTTQTQDALANYVTPDNKATKGESIKKKHMHHMDEWETNITKKQKTNISP